MTDGVREIDVCPECDSYALQRRTARAGGTDRDENSGKWRCEDCTHTFDEPTTRPARRGATPKNGLAATLEKIGREGGA